MNIPRNRKPCKGFGKTTLQKLHKRTQVRNAADGALFLDFCGLSKAEINRSIQVLNRLLAVEYCMAFMPAQTCAAAGV